MKKLAILLIVTFVLSTGSAFAAETIAKGDNPATGGGTLSSLAPAAQLISKMSKGVWVTARTSTLGYSLFTAHLNGDKAFGSAHDSTAIYTQQMAPADIAIPGVIGQVEFATLWTAL